MRLYNYYIKRPLFIFLLSLTALPVIARTEDRNRSPFGCSSTWTGAVNTNWNIPGNWCDGIVPNAAALVTIPSGVTNYPQISSANALAASVTINSGASVTMSGAYNLTISAGGLFTNNGTFNAASSTGAVIFAGNGTIGGVATSFNNVTINGVVDFGITGTATITGILTINAGASAAAVAGHIVTYGSASTLLYNASITTGNEWDRGGPATTAAGAGIPQNVIIQNGTVTIPNTPQANRALAGNLTISSGNVLQMTTGSRDLYIAGNWINNGGTFKANGRKVEFIGSATQLVVGATSFHDLSLANPIGVDFGTSVIRIANTLSNSLGAMMPGTSTIIFTGSACTMIGTHAKNFWNLQVNAGATVTHTTSGGNIHILNSLVNDGTLTENPLYTCYFDKSGATETISGTGTTTFGSIAIGGSPLSFPTIVNAGPASFTITGNTVAFNISNSSLNSLGKVTIALATAGTCTIKNASGITGTSANFYDVELNTSASSVATAVDFGNGISVINHTLTLNKLSSVITNAPVYGSAATLIYNTGSAAYNTGMEWSVNTTTPGNGSPQNVVIQNTDYIIMNGSRGIGGDLTIGAANTLNLNSNTITLNGAYKGAGFLSGSALSGLIINGIAGTVHFSPGGRTNVLQTLTVSGSGDLTLGDSLYMTAGSFAGTVISDGTLNSRGYLVLRSDINGTAAIGISTGSINGDVTVERYIATGIGSALNHKKSWQLLAVPAKGQTIKATWQEGATAPNANPHPGYGTMITSNVTGADAQPGPGFDAYTSPGPSIKVYNAATNKYDGPLNTNVTKVYNQKGYFVFVRGSRAVTAYNQPADATILRTTGILFTAANMPPVTNIGVGSIESIGNPYASPIDMRQINTTGGVEEFFTVWDPRVGGLYNYGAFVTFLFDGSNYLVATNGGGTYPADGMVSNYIQSGQAFFMETSPGMSGTVGFSEASKGGNSFSGTIFTRHKADSNTIVSPATGRLKITLLSRQPGTTGDALDEIIDLFNDSYSNKRDRFDARKIINTGENIAIRVDSEFLAIERRREVIANDTIFLNLSGLKVQDYQLHFDATNVSATTEGFVIDTYLQTRTPLHCNGATEVNFSIENITGSYASGRFMIVFSAMKALPVTFTSVKAYRQDKNITVEWRVSNENNIKEYQAERSANGIDFTTFTVLSSANNNGGSAVYLTADSKPLSGDNYYRIRSVDINGAISFTTIVKVTIADIREEISINPNPVTNAQIHLQFLNQPAGKYSLRLLNSAGQIIMQKEVTRQQGSSTELLKCGFNLAHGIYRLEVTRPDNSSETINVIY